MQACVYRQNKNHPGEPGEESDKDGERRKERGGELTLKQHNKETTPRTDERGRLHFLFLNYRREPPWTEECTGLSADRGRSSVPLAAGREAALFGAGMDPRALCDAPRDMGENNERWA